MYQSNHNIPDEENRRGTAAGAENNLITKDKEFDSSSESRGGDSGFISGPLSSEIQSSASHISSDDKEFRQQIYDTDSGLIDDTNNYGNTSATGGNNTDGNSTHLTEHDNNQEEDMIIDSGVGADLDVSDSFAKLHLDSKYTNNLGAASKTKENNSSRKSLTANIIVPLTQAKNNSNNTVVVTDPLRNTEKCKIQPTWENYYQQNDEGDT